VETIYTAHNIFDLDKLHRNHRRIMRRALATKVPNQVGGGITVLIITYLSETKPCLWDDIICFQNERYKLSNNNNPSGLPRGYYVKDLSTVSKHAYSKLRIMYAISLSTRHGVCIYQQNILPTSLMSTI